MLRSYPCCMCHEQGQRCSLLLCCTAHTLPQKWEQLLSDFSLSFQFHLLSKISWIPKSQHAGATGISWDSANVTRHRAKPLCLPLPAATRHYALPSLHMSTLPPFGFRRTDVQSCTNECLQNGKYMYKNTQHAYRKWWKTGLGAFSGATWKGWLHHLCNLHK